MKIVEEAIDPASWSRAIYWSRATAIAKREITSMHTLCSIRQGAG